MVGIARDEQPVFLVVVVPVEDFTVIRNRFGNVSRNKPKAEIAHRGADTTHHTERRFFGRLAINDDSASNESPSHNFTFP